MSRIVRLMGGVLLGAFVLGACGGGDEIGGAQQENAERADQICLDAQDKVGRELGDDAEADRDAVRQAAEQLLAINPPSENENTFELLRQNVNNLWIALEDVAQSRLPEVNDRARAQRALENAQQINGRVIRYADQYGATECAQGFGRSGEDDR